MHNKFQGCFNIPNRQILGYPSPKARLRSDLDLKVSNSNCNLAQIFSRESGIKRERQRERERGKRKKKKKKAPCIANGHQEKYDYYFVYLLPFLPVTLQVP